MGFAFDPSLPPEARDYLEHLLEIRLLAADEVEEFLRERSDFLYEYRTAERLGQALLQGGFLTRYQLDSLRLGQGPNLVLGNYRILQTLANGGMGSVYLAEHGLMKRRVAMKVLQADEDCPASVRQRFYAEMRVLAELNHQHIVLALDAGEVAPLGPNMPRLIYLAMELVDGGDLYHHVMDSGVCTVAQACAYIRQAASGLQAAHDHHLIHRDIKPSNLLRTQAGQVKVVDFGLARQFCSRLTDPRALLGSVEFMAPEQSHDPSAVGKEADTYGLGATLFFLLTGEAPYPYLQNVGPALRQLQDQEPRRLQELRPDAPAELDQLVAQMLERSPARRPSLLTVVEALADLELGQGDTERPGSLAMAGSAPRALIVDDVGQVRGLHRHIMQDLGYVCLEAPDGERALALLENQPVDLVLLDLQLPGMDGYEVCHRLRQRTDNPNLKIIVVSGAGTPDDLADALPHGADDYLHKPFHPRQLKAKAEHALRLRDIQERDSFLAGQFQRVNQQLQRSLIAREEDIRQAHNALLFGMAKMAESRDGETPGHMRRLQEYTRVLAVEAAMTPPWNGLIDERFLEQMERCVGLHDIGKIGLPEEVLLKPGALNQHERALVETHPLIGDRILEALAREHGGSLEFLGMARSIVRHHHERYDGKGYPDRLAEDAIPAAARLVAVADVYDALRRQRLHKPAMSHAQAIHILQERSEGQFDPRLLKALTVCHDQWEQTYEDMQD